MTIEQRIKAAIAYGGSTQTKVAQEMGTTVQNFGQKLKRETFTEKELQQIAQALGAEYLPFAFKFADGTRI